MRCLVCWALAVAWAFGAESGGLFVGFEQRVRNEQWSNILDFNDSLADDRNQLRWRTRAWLNVPLGKYVDVFAGLAQETNQIVSPRRPWRVDEVIFENAYIDVKRLWSPRWSLRVGRQNIALGEGFLVLDGGPWDGSRAIYFNAAMLTHTTPNGKLQLIGISDPAVESFLPQMHSQHRTLVEWDEQAVGAYYTRKLGPSTLVDVYGFQKREFADRRAASSVQYQPDKRVDTAGARLSQRFGTKWTAVAEFADQWGREAPGRKVGGAAGYLYVRRTFASWKQSYAQGGYWAFSGDWDPLFARWPKWSELYLYSLFHERGVGYWSNLGMWQAEGGLAPVRRMKVRGTMYGMRAFEPFSRGDQRIFGPGLGRGFNWQVRGDVSLDRHWSGHVLYERHLPGDFYARRTPGHFLRFEVMFSWVGNRAVKPQRSNP